MNTLISKIILFFFVYFIIGITNPTVLTGQTTFEADNSRMIKEFEQENSMEIEISAPNTIFNAEPSPEEIIKYITAQSDKIIAELDTIKDLWKLKLLEIELYGELKAYYDAYGSLLDKEDQLFCQGNIEICKKAIDNRSLELHTNPEGNDVFIKNIETGIETIHANIATATTNEAGEKLLDEFHGLNDYFTVRAKHATTLSPAWVNEMTAKLEHLRQNIVEKQAKLGETVYILGNHCTTISSVLTFEGTSRTITAKERGLVKQLAKINQSLTIEGYKAEDTAAENSSKIVSLLQKKSDIEQKQQLIYALGEHISAEVLTLNLVFCKKIIKARDTEYSYWGIHKVLLPSERKGAEPGAINISYDYKILESLFDDTAIISFKIKRNAYKEIKEKTILVDWKINIQTNKENNKDVTCSVAPVSEKDVLSDLNCIQDNIGLYYTVDMEKANKNLLKAMKGQMDEE